MLLALCECYSEVLLCMHCDCKISFPMPCSRRAGQVTDCGYFMRPQSPMELASPNSCSQSRQKRSPFGHSRLKHDLTSQQKRQHHFRHPLSFLVEPKQLSTPRLSRIPLKSLVLHTYSPPASPQTCSVSSPSPPSYAKWSTNKWPLPHTPTRSAKDKYLAIIPPSTPPLNKSVESTLTLRRG